MMAAAASLDEQQMGDIVHAADIDLWLEVTKHSPLSLPLVAPVHQMVEAGKSNVCAPPQTKCSLFDFLGKLHQGLQLSPGPTRSLEQWPRWVLTLLLIPRPLISRECCCSSGMATAREWAKDEAQAVLHIIITLKSNAARIAPQLQLAHVRLPVSRLLCIHSIDPAA